MYLFVAVGGEKGAGGGGGLGVGVHPALNTEFEGVRRV